MQVQPVEVWTKCGRRGRVKEPVGTHGKMPIQQDRFVPFGPLGDNWLL